jgi:hypothetical protein
MAKITGVTLGTVIAFVAPGFVGLIAASYHSPLASAWLTAAVDKDQNVGVFFFVLLASLALGIVISGVRALVLDYVYTRGIRVIHYARIAEYTILEPVDLSIIHFDQLADDRRLTAFETVVEFYYRFYQFYANTFIALLLLLVARSSSQVADGWPTLVYLLIALALVVLFFSARMSLEWYCIAAARLFTSDRSQTDGQRPTTGRQEEEGGEESHQEKEGPEEEDREEEGKEEGELDRDSG